MSLRRRRVLGGIVAAILLVSMGTVAAALQPPAWSAQIQAALNALGYGSSTATVVTWTKWFQFASGTYLNWGATTGASGYGLRDNAGTIEAKGSGGTWAPVATATGVAPAGATYLTQTPHANLSAEQALSANATGLMLSTTGTGVVTTYAGTTPCAANAWIRALSSTGVATCNTASSANLTDAANIPLLNGTNIWTAVNSFTAAVSFSGGSAGSIAVPPIIISNNKLLAWFDNAGLTTNGGFLWYDASHNLLLGTAGATRATLSATLFTLTGGLTLGSGTVALVGSDGKINGPLSSIVLDDMSAANFNSIPAGQLTGSIADARLSANVPLLNVINTFSAFGVHLWSAGSAGTNALRVVNSSAGVANIASVQIGNDASAIRFVVNMYSSTFTTSGGARADGALLQSVGVGGLNLSASDAAGRIRFYTNGVLAGQVTNLSTLSWSGTVDIFGGLAGNVSDAPLTVDNNKLIVWRDNASGLTNPGFLWYDNSHNFSIGTANLVRFTFTAGGNMGLGTTTPGTGITGKAFELFGNSAATVPNVLLTNDWATNSDAIISLRKSRSGGAITTADYIGEFRFQAHDGTSYITAADIIAVSEGTIATGQVPTSIRFGTEGLSGTYAERMRISPAGIIKIAGSAVRGTTEGTNHLDIFDGTAPVGTLTNGISFYSVAGEARVMDAAGNSTLLSPHGERNQWIFLSKNTVTGQVLRIEMEDLVAEVERLSGKSFTRRWKESVK